jgi:hypothetical protein
MVWPGKKHANAIHFKQIEYSIGQSPLIDDSLLDATLFVVDVITAKYVDIFNYFTLHKFPNGILEKEKKRLIPKTSSYTIIGETLYKLRI